MEIQFIYWEGMMEIKKIMTCIKFLFWIHANLNYLKYLARIILYQNLRIKKIIWERRFLLKISKKPKILIKMISK
jgi:hypothetical protein